MNRLDELVFCSIHEHWDEIKRKVQQHLSVSEISYNLWIEPLELEELKNNYVYIGCEKEDERALEYLHKRFNLAFGTVIYEMFGKIVTVVFKIKGETINQEFENAYQDTLKINPLNTFDSFIVGKCNEMAYQVSTVFAEDPEGTWNPVYIYGDVGLGKTHLLHAIGNYILKNNPAKSVLYVTCKQYLNDVVNSVRDYNGINTFKAKYLNADVLLIDDLDQIIGKEASLELFVDMVDAFRESDKQIVVTADRNYREFDNAPKRFVARIAYGMIVDLSSLDFETSSMLIQSIADNKRLSLSDEIIKYVAANFGTNVPNLHGILNKIEFLSKQGKKESDILEEITKCI